MNKQPSYYRNPLRGKNFNVCIFVCIYVRICAICSCLRPECVRSSGFTGDGCLALDTDPLRDQQLLSHLSGPKIHFEVIMEEQEIAENCKS